MIDYGFPASEYYHPQRADGTLMAHSPASGVRPICSPDPGLQDMTATSTSAPSPPPPSRGLAPT